MKRKRGRERERESSFTIGNITRRLTKTCIVFWEKITSVVMCFIYCFCHCTTFFSSLALFSHLLKPGLSGYDDDGAQGERDSNTRVGVLWTHIMHEMRWPTNKNLPSRKWEREREKNCIVNVAPNTLEVTVGGPQVWYNLDLTDTWMD